jgi:hypothetical protein
MQTDAYDLVTQRLEQKTGYRPSGTGDWKCPVHAGSTGQGDRRPSLSVSRGNNDNVVLYCHANCSTEDVVRALNLEMKDLRNVTNSNGSEGHREQPTDVYPYVDEHGTLLYEVLRFPGKQFRQRVPKLGGQWEWKLGDTRRVLFHLPQLLTAIADRQPVFVCEGEKDVLAIERAGGIATCNSGGAGKWRPEFTPIFAGADVVIVGDNDEVGRHHAVNVEAALTGVARRVRQVTALEGKDAFDHLASGHTLEEWLAAPTGHELERVLLGHLITGGVPDPVMVHSWLYGGGLHSIQSEPGVGKSWLALWIAKQLIEAGWSVIYLDEEGGENLVSGRLGALGVDPDLVDQRFYYYPYPQRKWTEEDIDALRDVINQMPSPVGAGFLDSLPDFLATAGLSEDSSIDVTGFVQQMLTPFREVMAALVVLDHLTKPTTENGKKTRTRYARGSGAKLSKAHLTLLLETGEDFNRQHGGYLRLTCTKDREGFVDLPSIHQEPLILEVNVGGGGLTIEVGEQKAAAITPYDGPTRCISAVLGVLQAEPGTEMNTAAVRREVKEAGHPFRDSIISVSLAKLVAKELIQVRGGPKNSKLYKWDPAAEAAVTPDEMFDPDERF